MKIRTPYNSKAYPKNYEVNTMPHMTIPDQTMSISEIMARYARGLPISGERVPVYNGEEDLPDLDRMDLAERQEALENAREEYVEIQKRLIKKRLPNKKPSNEQDVQTDGTIPSAV